MRFYGIKSTRMPICGHSSIERRSNWFERPRESACIGGGFIFSHGHLIKNAGYSKHFNNIF